MCDVGNGTFVEYDQLVNLEIETAYIANFASVLLQVKVDPKAGQSGPAQNYDVKIDFAQMLELDMETNKTRTVRRSDCTGTVSGKIFVDP